MSRLGESNSFYKHGHSSNPSPEYKSWESMKQRCLNPKFIGFKYYGGRGVSICKRWLESFENFLSDMGPRPEGHSLDRFPDRNGNYEPGNCRWATPKEQQRNKRNNRIVEIDGHPVVLASACESIGVDRKKVLKRLNSGVSFERAVDPTPLPRKITGFPAGERHPDAKITAKEVIEIRELYRAGVMQKVLAQKFGLAQNSISNIVNRKHWKHV